MRMLQQDVEGLAQADINIHALLLSTELAMSSWKAIRLIQHDYPSVNSWGLLTKMFLYFVCLLFAKIIYSINISIDKMRVIGFVAPWILLPNLFQTFPLIVLALPRLVNVTLQ